MVRCTNLGESIYVNILGATTYDNIWASGYGCAVSQFLLGEKRLVSSSIEVSQMGKTIANSINKRYYSPVSAIPYWNFELNDSKTVKICGYLDGCDEV